MDISLFFSQNGGFARIELLKGENRTSVYDIQGICGKELIGLEERSIEEEKREGGVY